MQGTKVGFMRDILTEKKLCLMTNEVNHMNVPAYQEISVKNLYEDAMKDELLVKYLPTREQLSGRQPERDFFFFSFRCTLPQNPKTPYVSRWSIELSKYWIYYFIDLVFKAPVKSRFSSSLWDFIIIGNLQFQVIIMKSPPISKATSKDESKHGRHCTVECPVEGCTCIGRSDNVKWHVSRRHQGQADEVKSDALSLRKDENNKPRQSKRKKQPQEF